MSGILDLVGLSDDLKAAIKEVTDIYTEKHELELNEIKEKIQKPCESLLRCQIKVSKLPPPNTIKDSLALSCCIGLIYRTLANVNQLIGEKEQSCGFLVKVLAELEKVDKGTELFQLEAALYLGATWLDLNRPKEAKKVLTKCKQLYDKCRARGTDCINAEDTSLYYFLCFDFVETTLEAKDDPSFEDLIDLMHVALLRIYEQYFTALKQYQKMFHYGCLVLKYTLQYNCYQCESWIEHALDLSPYCCECMSFAQSNVLICAANTLLDVEKDKIRKTEFGPNTIEMTNICRYLQGRIALCFAQHLILSLYVVRNRQLILARSGLNELSEEDKKDMQVCSDVIEFEHLPKKLTNRNKAFEQICSNEGEIRNIYDKIREYLTEATSILTEDERSSNDYPAIAQKCDMLKQVFEFLN